MSRLLVLVGTFLLLSLYIFLSFCLCGKSVLGSRKQGMLNIPKECLRVKLLDPYSDRRKKENLSFFLFRASVCMRTHARTRTHKQKAKSKEPKVMMCTCRDSLSVYSY